jgi:hypothetical protein
MLRIEGALDLEIVDYVTYSVLVINTVECSYIDTHNNGFSHERAIEKNQSRARSEFFHGNIRLLIHQCLLTQINGFSQHKQQGSLPQEVLGIRGKEKIVQCRVNYTYTVSQQTASKQPAV